MIFDDKMILQAMKEGNKDKTNTYKLIKAKIQQFKTAKNAKNFDEAAEINLLQKMATEIKEDIELYKTAKPSLADEYGTQLKYIEELLPEPVSELDIDMAIDAWENTNGVVTQKVMGQVIKYVKENLVGADGKLVSKLVRDRFTN